MFAYAGPSVKSRRQVAKERTCNLKDTYFLVEWEKTESDDSEQDTLFDILPAKAVIADVDLLEIESGAKCQGVYRSVSYPVKIVAKGSRAELEATLEELEKANDEDTQVAAEVTQEAISLQEPTKSNKPTDTQVAAEVTQEAISLQEPTKSNKGPTGKASKRKSTIAESPRSSKKGKCSPQTPQKRAKRSPRKKTKSPKKGSSSKPQPKSKPKSVEKARSTENSSMTESILGTLDTGPEGVQSSTPDIPMDDELIDFSPLPSPVTPITSTSFVNSGMSSSNTSFTSPPPQSPFASPPPQPTFTGPPPQSPPFASPPPQSPSLSSGYQSSSGYQYPPNFNPAEMPFVPPFGDQSMLNQSWPPYYNQNMMMMFQMQTIANTISSLKSEVQSLKSKSRKRRSYSAISDAGSDTSGMAGPATPTLKPSANRLTDTTIDL